jgi:hypothetical protein
MSLLIDRINLLSTTVANYIRDSIKPRLIPSGGSTKQILTKTSGTDYDVSWTTHKTVQYSVQLGTPGKRLIAPFVVTITDADVIPTSMVEAWYSPITNAVSKEFEDDAEFDYLDVRVIPSSVTTGSFKVAITARTNGRVNNQKTIMYRVQN